MQTNNIPTKLFLFRHTQTINTLNGDFRYNGFIDVDVDEKGLDVLKRFIPFIKKQNIKAIYSSDLTRAIKGAEIFSKALNIKVIFSEKLREVKQGRWEGLVTMKSWRDFPRKRKKNFKIM